MLAVEVMKCVLKMALTGVGETVRNNQYRLHGQLQNKFE